MMRKFLARSAALAACLMLAAPLAHAQQAMRPAIGRPLQKARAAIAAHRFAEANAALRQAEAVPGKTEEEEFVITQMRGAVAQGSGNLAQAAQIYQQLLDSGRVSGSTEIDLLAAESSFAWQLHNYPAVVSWVQKYERAGGTDPRIRGLIVQAYYQNGDYASAARLEQGMVNAMLRARQRPTEDQLKLLADCQRHTGDATGFHATMVDLVFYYPSPDYWANLIHDVQVAPGFADRLAFDIYRFQMVLGLVTTQDDYMEMAELALQVPLPGEAKDIVDKGYAAGVLGVGPAASRNDRLRAMVGTTFASEQKSLAAQAAADAGDHDHNKLEALGEEYVSYGLYAQGIPMIQQALQLDDLRHPEDAKLHLALAYWKSGDKDSAIATLRTVGGQDGTYGIAQLWLLYLSRQ